MKKLCLLILFLTTFGLSSFSQSGIYSGGVSGIAKHDLRKTGWIVRPELGGLYGDYRQHISDVYYIFTADAGYQLSPYIYLGGGLECFVGVDSYYNSNTGIYGFRDKMFPLYACFRWYWYDGLSSPFLELNAGGGISNNSEGIRSCGIINSAIGYDIRNFDVKLSVPVFLGNNPAVLGGGICVTIGYNLLIKT